MSGTRADLIACAYTVPGVQHVEIEEGGPGLITVRVSVAEGCDAEPIRIAVQASIDENSVAGCTTEIRVVHPHAIGEVILRGMKARVREVFAAHRMSSTALHPSHEAVLDVVAREMASIVDALSRRIERLEGFAEGPRVKINAPAAGWGESLIARLSGPLREIERSNRAAAIFDYTPAEHAAAARMPAGGKTYRVRLYCGHVASLIAHSEGAPAYCRECDGTRAIVEVLT